MLRLRRNPELLAVQWARSLAAMGVREDGGHNRGRWVDAIVAIAGYDPDDAHSWCAMFACAAMLSGGLASGMRPRMHITGGVARLWQRSAREGALLIPIAAVREGAELRPGDIMIRGRDEAGARRMERGESAYGHTEIVVRHGHRWLHTVGGNTTSGDSAEGDGVYDKPRGCDLQDPRLVGFVRPGWVAI